MNPTLSIALPTFNRAPFLDAALTQLIATVSPHDIGILVSDNASTDDTAEIVRRHAASYPLLRYERNADNLGPDGNFEAVLRKTETRYVWLLGDTYEIEPEALHRVLAVAQSDQAFDVIVVDVEARAKYIPEQTYTDRNRLLAELGWHMTCMSALILERELVKTGVFERYRDTSFIHVGIVFDYLARRSPKVRWLNGQGARRLHVSGQTKVSVWEQHIFEVWVDRWVSFVFSLPASYTVQAKLACALSHAQRTGLFSLVNLVKLRASGVLTTVPVCRRWEGLRLALAKRRFTLLTAAIIPVPLARLAMRAGRRQS